jgi:hypothetical protein
VTPAEFITKWRNNPLTERQASHTHFIDLCGLLDEPPPYAPGTDPEAYCFERGATKTTGADGWADVWKRGAFGWEYKGPRKDLTTAYVQLQQYAVALENPPLLVVCDRERFRIHTNFTNSVGKVIEIELDELAQPEKRAILAIPPNEESLLSHSLTTGLRLPDRTRHGGSLIGPAPKCDHKLKGLPGISSLLKPRSIGSLCGSAIQCCQTRI